jgi:hypothetical protein
MIVPFLRSSGQAAFLGGVLSFLLLCTGCSSQRPDEASRAQTAQELQQLREANRELQRLREENKDLERLRRENQELAKLRSVSDELPKLREENAQLRAQLESLKPAPKPR